MSWYFAGGGRPKLTYSDPSTSCGLADTAPLGFDPKMALPDDDYLGAATLDGHQEETPVAERAVAERPASPRVGDGETQLELSSLLQNENALNNDGSLQSLLAMEPDDRGLASGDDDPFASFDDLGAVLRPDDRAPTLGEDDPFASFDDPGVVSRSDDEELPVEPKYIRKGLIEIGAYKRNGISIKAHRRRRRATAKSSESSDNEAFVDPGPESDPGSDSDFKCAALDDSDEELIVKPRLRVRSRKAPVKKKLVKKKLIKKKPKVVASPPNEVFDVLGRALLGNADFSESIASLGDDTVLKLLRSGGFNVRNGSLVLLEKHKAFLLYESLEAGPAAP